jgi:antitoxin component HigA of HigAB toxin-antitoxin module
MMGKANVASESAKGWLSDYEARFADDPVYVAESMALDFSEQIAQLMEERQITRSDLAAKLGVSRAYITRVLNAPPNLTLRTISQLCLALGVRPRIDFVRSGDERPVHSADSV